MHGTVLLIGTLDTKEEEFTFCREQIEAKGYKVIILDMGIMSDPSFKPEIPAKEVAEAGGSSLDVLREKADRKQAFEVMVKGAQKIALSRYRRNKFDGVLSLGGGSGTSLATAVMRILPFGVPKLMVSSVASGDVSAYVDIKDITLMYSVADISGLNPISRKILLNATGAICGMVGQKENIKEKKPLLAASMFGVTTPCVTAVRKKLEAAGYEVIIFHATGTGGRTLEAMIRDGYIAGVADITTTEWCDEVVGGILSAGPNRLSAAAEQGIPQVVSCGALDMVNFGAMASVPKKFQTRNLHPHTSQVTLMRTTPEECQQIGKRIAQKLNKVTGPAVLMLPLQGVSMLDKEGETFFNPKANNLLFETLKKHLDSKIIVKELDYHINDPAFAEAIAEEMLKSLK